MKIKCRVGWHNWGSWGDPIKGYTSITQFIECKDCGIISSRERYFQQVKTELIIESLNHEN